MLWLGRRLFFGHLGAVGCASALALARVLAFATIVARFAAALALARVLAFTGVLFLHLLVRLLVGLLLCILSGGGSLRPVEQIRSLDAGAASRAQPRDCGTRQKKQIRLSHFPRDRLIEFGLHTPPPNFLSRQTVNTPLA